MRVLLIRPEVDNKSTASALEKHNVDVACDPLLIIRERDPGSIDFNAYQAIIFTSPNAIRSYPYPDQAKNILTFTVGKKTAAVAQEYGFKHVISGDGDVDKLSDTIKFTIFTKNGPILYPCGVDRAGNLSEELSEAFFSVDAHEVYEANAAKSLSEETIRSLQTRKIDYIPFYSPRSAHIFIELVKTAGLEDHLKSITALCLSKKIEDVVSAMSWNDIKSAPEPNQTALFNLIGIDFEGTSK